MGVVIGLIELGESALRLGGDLCGCVGAAFGLVTAIVAYRRRKARKQDLTLMERQNKEINPDGI